VHILLQDICDKENHRVSFVVVVVVVVVVVMLGVLLFANGFPTTCPCRQVCGITQPLHPKSTPLSSRARMAITACNISFGPLSCESLVVSKASRHTATIIGIVEHKLNFRCHV
jgi:hypothetical protein